MPCGCLLFVIVRFALGRIHQGRIGQDRLRQQTVLAFPEPAGQRRVSVAVQVHDGRPVFDAVGVTGGNVGVMLGRQDQCITGPQPQVSQINFPGRRTPAGDADHQRQTSVAGKERVGEVVVFEVGRVVGQQLALARRAQVGRLVASPFAVGVLAQDQLVVLETQAFAVAEQGHAEGLRRFLGCPDRCVVHFAGVEVERLDPVGAAVRCNLTVPPTDAGVASTQGQGRVLGAELDQVAALLDARSCQAMVVEQVGKPVGIEGFFHAIADKGNTVEDLHRMGTTHARRLV